MALPILLDCDPGHDDAIAIVLALASPELDVKAITSSAGNQTPEKTLRNVLRMLTLLNRTDIPVAGGAVKPLMRELIIADNVHGESGLDGPFVGRDDACYFPYLHDPFPLLLLLHRLCRFMRCGSAPRSRPRCGTFGRSVPPCFAAGGIGRGCVRGCGRGILSCNRCRRRCSPSGSAIPVRT